MCFRQMMEAELQYRQCLNDARIQQDELVKVKERIVSHIRKLICQGDTVLKEVGGRQAAEVQCRRFHIVSLFEASHHQLLKSTSASEALQ